MKDFVCNKHTIFIFDSDSEEYLEPQTYGAYEVDRERFRIISRADSRCRVPSDFVMELRGAGLAIVVCIARIDG